MNSAGPLMRLYVVATNFDPEIVHGALDNYEPAEPLSVGALTAGGLAALWGWAATRLVAWRSAAAPAFARRACNRGRRTRDRPAPAPLGTYVKASMPGLAATSEGVTPVSVRLSPCVSEIVRPDEVLVAWDMTAARSSACVMPGVR